MAMRIEQGTCTGRGFAATDATGFCAKFKTWVVKSTANGGPGWFILVDKSATPVAKTITAVNTTTEEITITGHGFLNGEPISFANSGGALPGGLAASTKYYALRIDANTIKVCTTWANWINKTVVNLSNAGTGTNTAIMVGPYIVVSDKETPAVMDNAKIIKVGYESSYSGYASIQFFFSKGWDADCHPIGVWAGNFIKTVDAGAFTYNFRGGNQFLLLQSRPPAGGVWWRVGIDDFSPLTNFLEDYNSVGATVNANVSYTPGTNETIIECVTQGEADTLTKGEGYFIYYCGVPSSDGRLDVSYGILSKKGTVDGLASNKHIAFSSLTKPMVTGSPIYAGAKITPYWHRYFHFANTINEGSILIRDYCGSTYAAKSCIPYNSYNTDGTRFCYNPQDDAIYSSCRESTEDMAVVRGAQDNGKFVAQRPLILDYYHTGSSQTGLNRLWGESKNLYVTATTGMTDMETGRNIDGNDHIYIGNENTLFSDYSASLAVLVLHTESN